MRDDLLSRVHWGGRTVAIRVANGRIAAIEPVEGPAQTTLVPALVEPHVHLDKTFSWGRIVAQHGRPAPGLDGAIAAIQLDKANWSEDDVRARATRALIEAESAGVSAIRTHVDWMAPEEPASWRALADVAQEWAGRVTLQRAGLTQIDLFAEPGAGVAIADGVARRGGVLGAFIYPTANLAEKIGTVFDLAAARALSLDFHVDESLDPDATGFDLIAAETLRRGYGGKVLCGHACALSIRPPDEARRALDLAARAGVALTALPTCNLWLQDMTPGRTPRLRGIAPVKEAREAGVSILFGADNVGDVFYPYGCYDPLETLRLAAPMAHLDPAEWSGAISTDAARVLGVDAPRIEIGASANFLLIEAADWNEVLRRPAVARRRVRAGIVSASSRPGAVQD